ncbi:MAG TPA: hypothetical protein VEV82_02785, partial [Actinomycetota bacterium]|nr:hypothetical protein [Actinomycetota bacterium]
LPSPSRHAFPSTDRRLVQATVLGMELTGEDIREFIDAWQKDFGETISTAEARKHASALMEICLLMARPLPEGEHEKTTSP